MRKHVSSCVSRAQVGSEAGKGSFGGSKHTF